MEHAYLRLAGVGGRLFADPQPAADESSFQVDNTSVQYYNSPYYTLHKDDLQPVPVPRVPEPRMDLHDLLGANVTGPIEAAKVISFHAVGDTGAAKANSFQTAAQAIAHEAGVADALAHDVKHGGATAPAFFSILVMLSTTSVRRSITTTSSTSRSAPTTGLSLRYRETTTAWSSATRARHRRCRPWRPSCGTSAR